MNRILGLDIGRSFAIGVVLEEHPENLKAWYKENKEQFWKLEPNREGAEKFLELNPTEIVLEPTGYWYSSFWYRLAKANNIKVNWCGHRDAHRMRGVHGFPNKNDYTDALVLAASYFNTHLVDEHGRKRYLTHYLPEEITRVRELFYATEQLDKIRNTLVNQLRQRLSQEFPEIADYSMTRQGKYDYSPSIGWIAGIRDHKKLDNLWNKSKSKELGLRLSKYTQEHAKKIIEIEEQQTRHEAELDIELNKEIFLEYIRVFDLFGFGRTLKTILLLNCYPFERFLVNGKEDIEHGSSKDGKRTTKNKSLRDFQAFLGMSKSFEISGTSVNKSTFHGSKQIRSHLYIFAMARLAVGKSRRVNTPLGEKLGETYEELRNKGIHGKDAVIRTLYKLTRYLYKELRETTKKSIEEKFKEVPKDIK